jgi:hypothetical protein
MCGNQCCQAGQQIESRQPELRVAFNVGAGFVFNPRKPAPSAAETEKEMNINLTGIYHG